MAQEDFTINSAAHTGFTVASLAAALKFWHDLLGLPILHRRTLDLGPGQNPVGVANAKMEVALLSLPGGHQVELLEYTSPEDRTAMKPRPCDVGNVHLALNVRNSATLIAEAKKLGWEPAAEEPVRITRGDGTAWTVCYIRGPDGVTVELMVGILMGRTFPLDVLRHAAMTQTALRLTRLAGI